MPTTIGFRVSRTNDKHTFIEQKIKEHALKSHTNVSEYIADLIYKDMKGQNPAPISAPPEPPKVQQVTSPEPVKIVENPVPVIPTPDFTSRIRVNDSVEQTDTSPATVEISPFAKDSVNSLMEW